MDISTLLSIGNVANPKAENVNAVVGRMQDDFFECLVFVENTPQDLEQVTKLKQKLKQEKHAQTPNNQNSNRETKQDVKDLQPPIGKPVAIRTDVGRGRLLLENWASQETKYAIQTS